MTFEELAERVKRIDMEKLKAEAVRRNADAIAELNRDQLRRGLTASGDFIRPPYRSFTYADLKKASGSLAPFGTPDLKYTGSFHQDMETRVDSRTFNVMSTDDKADELQRKYGSDIFGLTEENKEKARAMTTRTLSEEYRKLTGLKG